jgi:hypothetical protein
LRIVYIDTTGNENNELGFTNEDNFKIPDSGTIINVKNEKFELKNASIDGLNKITYLHLIKATNSNT